MIVDEVQLNRDTQTRQRRISNLGKAKAIRRVIGDNHHQINFTILVGFPRGMRTEEVDFQRMQRCNEALNDLLQKLAAEVFHDVDYTGFNGFRNLNWRRSHYFPALFTGSFAAHSAFAFCNSA